MSSEENIIIELAKLFEIKQIPATEWEMMRIVAEGYPLDKLTPTENVD